MYHDQHGVFPPAYIADEKGKPKHSWRVLILPQLGEQSLYRDYDMNQPWDSPTNMALISRMPDVYASPGDDDATSLYNTSYLAVVGPNAIFQGTKSLRMSDIQDGPETTILVVESTGSGIAWLEPKDLSARTMGYTINGDVNNCIRSHHPGGANVVSANERARFLTEDLPTEQVEAMVTANKKDEVTLDAMPEP
jgi:hypothetical protein